MPRSATTVRSALTTRDGDAKPKGKQPGRGVGARTSTTFKLDASLIGLIAELRAAARARQSTRQRLAGEFLDDVMNTAREIAAVKPKDIGPFFEALHSASAGIPSRIQALITAECQAERNLLACVVRAVSKS